MIGRSTSRDYARIVLVTVALVASAAARAVDSEPDAFAGGGPRTSGCGLIVTPVPAIFYTPETRLGLGLGMPAVYRTDGKCTGRESIVVPLALYTQLQQTIMRALSKHYFGSGSDFYAENEVYYAYYPDRFYGIGDRTKLSDEEEFKDIDFSLSSSVFRRVVGEFYVGPLFLRDTFRAADVQPGGLLASPGYAPLAKGTASGAGLKLLRNTRDNKFQAKRGSALEVVWLGFGRRLGSDFTFSHAATKFRVYIPVGAGETLAIAANLVDQRGDVPIRELAQVGGQYSLRGYYQGRFRDKAMASTEVELRHEFDDRWSAVIFSGAGYVAPALADLGTGRLLHTSGAGIRWVLGLESRVNLRLDYGIAGDSRGIYIGGAEAF